MRARGVEPPPEPREGFVFYDVGRGDESLVLRLHDERYEAVYVEVHPPQDPRQLADQIERAVAPGV